MQIFGLHKNIYKLANYSLRAENKDKYRCLCEEPVARWNKLKREGVSDKVARDFCGFSRASYFRYKRGVTLTNSRKAPSRPLEFDNPSF